MINPRDGMKYFMPLTQGRPSDGPAVSVFSVPKTQYSKETEALVKNLMRESRLTFTQKHVFETILRDGKSLPEHPTQLMHSRQRLKYMQQCHMNKARHIGVPLIEPEIQRKQRPQYHTALALPGSGKRTLETIQASGDLQAALPPPTCIPASKEAEKDRLAHRMAFGTDKNDDKTAKIKGDKAPLNPVVGKTDTVDQIKQMRFEELIDEIRDRMQFLLMMEKEKKEKEYRPCILNQINEKLQEMKKISPNEEKVVRESLKLHLLDKRYSSTFMSENNPSNFFDR